MTTPRETVYFRDKNTFHGDDAEDCETRLLEIVHWGVRWGVRFISGDEEYTHWLEGENALAFIKSCEVIGSQKRAAIALAKRGSK